MSNSIKASQAFGWPVAQNPTIISEVEQDPTGQSVADSDVQFVVNSNLETIIDQWASEQSASTSPAA